MDLARPRIKDRHSGRGNIFDVAGHEREIVVQGGGGQEAINYGRG